MSLAVELQDVCGKLDRREIDRDTFVGACTRLTTLHVGCSRAGIWTILDAAGGPLQHCLGLYDAVADRRYTVPDISIGAESYVVALHRDGHVLADDVRTHPATAAWFRQTLQPEAIESWMAAPFSVNGRLSGVFTCAQVGERQHWTPGQLALLKRIAVRASLSLASATSFTLSTLPAPLMELPPLTDSTPFD